MKIYDLRHLFATAAAMLGIAAVSVSCSTDGFGSDGAAESGLTGFAEVTLAVPQISTRTIIDTDQGGSEAGQTLSLRWADGDCLSLWAVGPAPFSNRVFTYTTDNYADPDRVLFKGSIPRTRTAGEYTYYAFYPGDKGETGESEIAFTIPVVQNGTYDPELDIMYAVASGKELTSLNLNNLDFRFRHLTHALKITIPEGSNSFGHDIYRIEIEFPQPVAGRVIYDVASQTMRNDLTDNKIVVEFDEPVSEGEPFWVFLAPTESVEGTVKFTPYGGETAADSDRYTADASETTAFKKFEAGHITPVNLGLKEGFSITWFDFEVDWSRLGEPVHTLHLTLPEGQMFLNRTSAMVVGSDPEDGKFKVPFRTAEIESWGSTTLTPVYESEHALAPEDANNREPQMTIVPGSFVAENHNPRSVTAPWLFFEDFSRVESFNNQDEWSNSASTSSYEYGPFLGGWSGGRIGAMAGVAIRIACRRQTAIATLSARVDSPQMSALKEGASVKIRVTYDYGMDRWGSKGLLGTSNGRDGGENYPQTVYYGYVEDADNTVFNSGNTTINECGNFQINELAPDGDQTAGYYDIPHKDESFTISECNNITRITWRTVPQSGGGGNNNTFWFYIDNVRVSIEQ